MVSWRGFGVSDPAAAAGQGKREQRRGMAVRTNTTEGILINPDMGVKLHFDRSISVVGGLR
jgi:hypothetical protein